MNMDSDSIIQLMKKNNIHPKKSLGQNFLTDQVILDKIVESADISKNDMVIEIGPGLGVLTKRLCEKAGIVLAVELDRDMIKILGETLDYKNLKIIYGDIMRLNLKELIVDNIANFSKVKVVANLPYYITTPIIMRLLEEKPGISTITIMVQKEVAQRMSAKPGGKDYGALTLAVNYYTKPEIILYVPRHSFYPAPEVDSAVIRLNVLDKPSIEVDSEEVFFKVVKAAFAQRRKTLVNALYNSGISDYSKEELFKIIKDIGLNENQRGETLSIGQFARLANLIR